MARPRPIAWLPASLATLGLAPRQAVMDEFVAPRRTDALDGRVAG